MWTERSSRNAGAGRNRLTIMAAVLAFVGLTLATYTAAAQDKVRKKFKDRVHVVQPKPVLQKGRFEIAPRFGMSVNDSVNQSFKVGANANYHIIEPLYVGLLAEWYDFGDALGGPTETYENVQNQTGTTADAADITWLGGLEVGFVPIFGKFSLFNSAIIFYDIALTAGGVFIDAASVGNTASQQTAGGTISLMNHIFLSKWFALNIEVRDTIFLVDLVGSTGAFTNVVTASIGTSFYLPTSFEYEEKVVEPSE